jgi:hypothetical protein
VVDIAVAGVVNRYTLTGRASLRYSGTFSQ